METLKAYALSFVGVRYFWGGDDPISGFDCSGLVGELLRSAGVLPHQKDKMNAQMIYNALEKDAAHNTWGCGDIAFYGKDIQHITHIGFCIDQYRMVEAGGGGSDTVNDAQAIATNAFVRVRPIKYRRDFLCVIKPKYVQIGLI